MRNIKCVFCMRHFAEMVLIKHNSAVVCWMTLNEPINMLPVATAAYLRSGVAGDRLLEPVQNRASSFTEKSGSIRAGVWLAASRSLRWGRQHAQPSTSRKECRAHPPMSARLASSAMSATASNSYAPKWPAHLPVQASKRRRLEYS